MRGTRLVLPMDDSEPPFTDTHHRMRIRRCNGLIIYLIPSFTGCLDCVMMYLWSSRDHPILSNCAASADFTSRPNPPDTHAGVE
ncbi:hypothetical protein E3U43_001652 [Larimichthys crocea]|uniref:Uncharacterized protein n=1 Tax=Larimichthys crocea TaxID=215358 RepID=A0ACD3RE09_LARCR|nr:hypothetical protein E3U43_001652 [Larimichthys crocea]